MKVLICSSLKKEKSLAALPEVTKRLAELGITPLIPEALREKCRCGEAVYCDENEALGQCDMLLTIGGDGTILKWGKRAALAGKPLLGINTGRLGFMTALEADELGRLSVLRDGGYGYSRRMMLDVLLSGSNAEREFLALNDVVITKRFSSKLPEFSVRLNGIDISRIRADGLIFSTPTGSTAYALSAGGPIIEPSAECIEMTPLCAHTLLSRPMIFSENDIVTVSFSGYENSEVDVSVDGDRGIRFREGDVLTIRKSETFFNLIDIENNGFYSAVSNKLMQPLK